VYEVDDMSESLSQTSNMSEEAPGAASAIDPQEKDHAKEDTIVSDERPTAAPSFGRQDDSWLAPKKRRLRKELEGVEFN
jgi:hypothetical protein